MHTHVDKTRENKKLSLAPASTQKQHGSEAIMQRKSTLPDSRFAAFREMANNSPAAKQAAQLRALANHYAPRLVRRSAPAQRVVQRKELVHDKLNVAGEFHNISNGRRGNEAAYSTEMTAGGYWREGQFQVGGVAADDYELRAKNLIAYAKKADLGQWNQRDTDKLVLALVKNILKTSDLKVALQLFRPDELEFYKNYISKNVYDAYDETLLNKRILLQSIDNIDDALSLYHQRVGGSDKILAETVAAFQGLFAVVAMQIDYVIKNLAIGSTTDLAQQRSVAMHNGANQAAATLGLWKVGESHAQDMQSMGGKNYELLTSAEFDAGYDLYIARRAALAGIGPIANGNWKPYTKGLPSRPKGVSAIVDILQGAGNNRIAAVLRNIKTRAQQDHARASSNRHPKAQAFYAALAGMDVNNTASMNAIPGLMTGINL